MSRQPQSSDSPYGQHPQPDRPEDDTSLGGNDQSTFDAPIDDPGDAQHSSKSEPDGDGEEDV